jgi:hypothetical protein
MKLNRVPYEKRAGIDEPYMTLAEIADLMGCSRERVRQIEQRALGKMRKILASKGMTVESFLDCLRYNKPFKQGEILSDSNEYELMYDKEELND